MLHIKLRDLSIEHYESKYSVLTHTIDPWGRVKGQMLFSLVALRSVDEHAS